MKKTNIIKATAVSSQTGKLLASLLDSGFTTLTDVKRTMINKVPDSFEGKSVIISIHNLTEETYKVYTVRNANFSGLAENRPKPKYNTVLDKKKKALHPGKRVSASGKKYTENRSNRSDIDRRKKL